MKFAKLFELENDEQVLVSRFYDAESEEYKIRATTDFNGSTAEMATGYFSEEEQEMTFEIFDMELAVAFRKSMEPFFND